MVPAYVIDLIGRLSLIILSVVFTIRIMRTKVRTSTEQILTVIMVILTALSYNPNPNIILLHDQVIHVRNPRVWWVVKYAWVGPFFSWNRFIDMAVSSMGQLFHVWSCAHSFGILENKDRPSNLRFYGPKIFILLLYNAYRLILSRHLGSTLLNFPVLLWWI